MEGAREMKRYSFLKENGEVLRLIITEEQLQVEEMQKALENWKERWNLFSEGVDTRVRQKPNEQIVFSDDKVLWEGNEWEIRKTDEKWVCHFENQILLLSILVDQGYIIEP
jgi:hypothetical protein